MQSMGYHHVFMPLYYYVRFHLPVHAWLHICMNERTGNEFSFTGIKECTGTAVVTARMERKWSEWKWNFKSTSFSTDVRNGIHEMRSRTANCTSSTRARERKRERVRERRTPCLTEGRPRFSVYFIFIILIIFMIFIFNPSLAKGSISTSNPTVSFPDG